MAAMRSGSSFTSGGAVISGSAGNSRKSSRASRIASSHNGARRSALPPLAK
jgi:hypothetical protein